LRIRRFVVGGNTPSPKSVQQALELGGDWKATQASDIRQLMRRVPHSVAVITSNMPPKGFVGMTVSSFNTVCLEPRVVVSFNVKQPSATLNAICASGQFTVHIIDSTEQGAAIAELFASGRGREVLKDDDGVVSSTTSPSELEQRLPHLLSDNTVMFTLQCEVLDQTVEVADHVIVLGAVLTHRLPPHAGVWDRTSLGMCYVNRRYRRPGLVQLLPGERARLSEKKYAKKAAPSSTAASLSPKDDSTHEEVASSHEDATSPEFY
jgi:flavin reductase (DIM6/NTAB) family NADH-FMN oxidoreductase RutF